MDSNRLPFIESGLLTIIYWFDAEYNTIMDERLQAIVIGEQSDLSLSICSISSGLQENDTLPTCDLETSEDVTLPETFSEEQLEGTELEASRTEEKTRELG